VYLLKFSRTRYILEYVTYKWKNFKLLHITDLNLRKLYNLMMT
jgi:hypothetical protein